MTVRFEIWLLMLVLGISSPRTVFASIVVPGPVPDLTSASPDGRLVLMARRHKDPKLVRYSLNDMDAKPPYTLRIYFESRKRLLRREVLSPPLWQRGNARYER